MLFARSRLRKVRGFNSIGQDPPVLSGNAISGSPPNLQVELLMGISIPHTLDDLPIWQRLASTGKWDAAQKEDSGRAADSPICGVAEVTERKEEKP